jgi:hypothetical protein
LECIGFGAKNLRYYRPNPQADLVPAEVLINPGMTINFTPSYVMVSWKLYAIEDRIIRAGLRASSLATLLSSAGFAFLERLLPKISRKYRDDLKWAIAFYSKAVFYNPQFPLAVQVCSELSPSPP